jgi:hypothetical protein
MFLKLHQVSVMQWRANLEPEFSAFQKDNAHNKPVLNSATFADIGVGFVDIGIIFADFGVIPTDISVMFVEIGANIANIGANFADIGAIFADIGTRPEINTINPTCILVLHTLRAQV